MKAVLKWIVLLAVVGAAGYGGWMWYDRQSSTPVKYRFGATAKGDVVAWISSTGTVVPEETVDVGAQVNGQIATFGTDVDGKPVDYRSTVQEGAVLAKIDDALYAADVATAEAQLSQGQAQHRLAEANRDQARARLTQADQDWQRAQKLGRSAALSQADYDAAQSAYEQAAAAVKVSEATIGQAQASISIAQASLLRARRNLAYCVISSPVSGVIIDKRVDVGQTVVASFNAPSLFLIAKDLRRMLVLVQVNEADIGNVSPGQKVTFAVEGSAGRTFEGEVRKVRLNATMTQNVVTYTVEIFTDNSELKLLPYLTANVRFVTARRDDVLTVPNAALRFTPRTEDDQRRPDAPSQDTRAAAGARPPQANTSGGPARTEQNDRGSGQSSGRSRPERRPEGGRENRGGRGTIWILGADQQPTPVHVRTGLSDGVVTEISGEGLSEDMQVILGEQSTIQRAPQQGASPFTPQMRRGR